MADPKISQLIKLPPRSNVVGYIGQAYVNAFNTTMLLSQDANREFQSHCVFVDDSLAPDAEPCSRTAQYSGVWDSASNTCLVNPHAVKDHWTWITRIGKSITGVGGLKTETLGLVMAPLKTQYNSSVQFICATVIPFHSRIDVMFGLDYIHWSNAVLDLSNWRVYIPNPLSTIRLDNLSKIKARLAAEPIHMLSLCGGIEPCYAMALNLGFRIKTYLSSERSPIARQVASALYPNIRYLEPHDFMHLSNDQILETLEELGICSVRVITGFPCQPWSRLPEAPKGFDDPLAQLVVKGGDLITTLSEKGMLDSVLNETVVPHADLSGDVGILESLMGVKYFSHNALAVGSPASRPRLLGLKGASVQAMPSSKHINPMMVFEQEWYARLIPLRCLVARIWDTKQPILIYQQYTGAVRNPSMDERDRINPGDESGLTRAYGKVRITDKQRGILTGNAFSNDMVWAVMFQWVPSVQIPQQVLSADAGLKLASMSHQDAQAALARLSTPEMFALFSGMVAADFMPRIPTFVKDGCNSIPFQTRAPGTVPQKLQAAADYKVACMLRAGTHKVIGYSADIWLMLLFFKPKGRKVIAEFGGPTWNKGDELEALRPLVDYRPSNWAQYYPVYLVEWSPDNRLNISMIPPDTTHVADHDSSDAYHAMLNDELGKKMGCSKYKDSQSETVYLEPQCCQQGQAASAIWFSPWIRYGYTIFIGPNHIFW